MSQENRRCNEDAGGDPGLRRAVLPPQWKPWALVAFASALAAMVVTAGVGMLVDLHRQRDAGGCVRRVTHDAVLSGTGTASAPLQGGPVTSSGTAEVAPVCSASEVLQFDGQRWVCRSGGGAQ